MNTLHTTITPAQLAVFKKNAASIEWYRQAAAGKILYIGTPSIAVAEHFGYPSLYCLSKEFEGYYPLQELNREARETIAATKKSSQFIGRYYAAFAEKVKKIKKKITQAEKIDFATAPLNEIYKVISELDTLSYNMWHECFLVDKFDPEGEKYLQQELQQQGIVLSQEEFDLLLKPQKINFIEDSNLLLLQIAQKLKNSTTKPTPQQIRQALQPLLAKYYHIQNSWNVVVFLTPDNFITPLREVLQKSPQQITEMIASYHNKQQNIQAQALKIQQKYHLPSEIVNLFDLFRSLAYIRDERKEIVLLCNHFNELAAQRVAKEYSVPLSLLYNILPSELVTIHSTADFEELRPELTARGQYTFISPFSATETAIISGKAAQEVITILHSKLLEKYEHLQGTVASKGPGGKITGKVKIILGETHFSKFQEGDVLVAAMTRPEYVPLMKKAKAIITDEGGITCHAAVVARELGKPCIIGTGIATKKLFDERQVEIDTSTGMVKMIP